MRRLKTILVSLVLGTTTLAVAQPGPYDRDRDHDRDRQTDEGRRGPQYYEGSWSTLGTTSLYEPVQKLMVGRDAGRFQQVRLESTAGAPFVRRVEIRFLDNSLQTLDVRRRIRPGEPIDLPLSYGPKPISSITVIGRPERGAQLVIMGR